MWNGRRRRGRRRRGRRKRGRRRKRKRNMMKDHQTENENAFVSLLLFRKNEGYNTK